MFQSEHLRYIFHTKSGITLSLKLIAAYTGFLTEDKGMKLSRNIAERTRVSDVSFLSVRVLRV